MNKIQFKRYLLIYYTFLFIVFDVIVKLYKQPILSLFKYLQFNFDKSVLFDSIGVILTLISIVFTVLVLSITLERESIYGVSNKAFRKLLGKKYFRLFEMIIIFGCLLILIFLSINMYLYISLIYLAVISFTYSYMFIRQEILLITKDEKCLKTIIVESYHSNKITESDEDAKEVQQVLDKVITYMLLTKGFKETYDNLIDDDQNKNIELFHYLLNRYWLFFAEYNMKMNYLKSFKIDTYNDINILKVIEKTIKSLKYIFDFDNDFCFLEFINSDDIETIVYLINLLHDICLNSELINQFTKFFRSIIDNLKIYIIKIERTFNTTDNIDYNNFVNKMIQNEKLKKFFNILTKIIVDNISDNKVWPIDVIIRSNFVDSGSTTASFYIIFISIYFYFIVSYDKTIEQETKDIVNQFINVPLNNTNNGYRCFKDIVFEYINQLNECSLIYLLQYLIYLYDNIDKEDNPIRWYKPKFGDLNKYNHDFNTKLLCRCWIEIISVRATLNNNSLYHIKNIFLKFNVEKRKVLLDIFNDIKQDLINIEPDKSSDLYCTQYEIYSNFPTDETYEFIDKLMKYIDE